MRNFNVNDSIEDIELNFKVDKKMSEAEMIDLYNDFLENAEVLFDRKNQVRRGLIILHKNQHYLLSVIISKINTLNQIMIYPIDKEHVNLEIENIKGFFIVDKKVKRVN